MDTLHLDREGKKIIAHRGCSGLEMENTASAFVAAGNRSYYGIETDVHKTADGQYIIIHDDNTKRVAGDEMIVEKTAYDTLRSLRLVNGSGERERGDLIMPNLREYIRICKKYEKKSVLELKNHFEPAEIDEIIAIIREEGWLEQVIFISFDLPNMLCIREKLPEQEAQFLISDFPEWLPETLRTNRLDLDIKYTALTKESVEMLKKDDIRINVWTVNEPEEAMKLLDWGVDYVTSNILE